MSREDGHRPAGQARDPSLLDHHLYVDYAGVFLFKLIAEGRTPLMVFDGPRNFKVTLDDYGNERPLQSIGQNLSTSLYNCCMVRRDAFKRIHNYLEKPNKTPLDTATYNRDSVKVAETVLFRRCRG